MLTSEETILEEIAKVLTDAAYDDVSVVDALEAIKQREKARRIEKQRQAVEYAMNATYRIAQVQRVTIHDQFTGQEKPADKIVAGYVVTRRDLQAFASQHELDYDTLVRTVENRANQAANKQGARFQAYPKLYSEPTTDMEELAQDARDAARERAYIQAVNQGRAIGRRESTDVPRFLPFVGKR